VKGKVRHKEEWREHKEWEARKGGEKERAGLVKYCWRYCR
jgi:hypothetical protein